jgi:hypothetical protein
MSRSLRRMVLSVAGAALLVAPSTFVMAGPALPQGESIEIHTGRGKAAVRASSGARSYRSYSVQPGTRSYRAPAQPSTGRVIESRPMQPAPQRVVVPSN